MSMDIRFTNGRFRGFTTEELWMLREILAILPMWDTKDYGELREDLLNEIRDEIVKRKEAESCELEGQG